MAWSDLLRVGRESKVRPRREPISLESDHAYLCIRSVAADGRRHLMQYAIADDLGSVLLSVFGAADKGEQKPTLGGLARQSPFMTHPVFTPYYTVPISMLSLWTLLFATLRPDGAAADNPPHAQPAGV